MYRLVYKSSVKKDLDNLSNRDLERVSAEINSLRANPLPPGVNKIRGGLKNRFRIRCGDFRIGYLIDFSGRLVRIIFVRRRGEDTYQ